MTTERLTCEITGNQCGTDTWMVGKACECKFCQRWLLDYTIETYRLINPKPPNEGRFYNLIITAPALLEFAEKVNIQLALLQRDADERLLAPMDDLRTEARALIAQTQGEMK